MPRALLSVSNKDGLVDFARALVARGFELVSTGGTAAALSAAGIAVTNVGDVTGFPEMLDGRVKTLHPRIHGGILARRHHDEDVAALQAHGITPIDLVVVNLYPFAATAAKADIGFDELIEQIDIGGPSMVRAAAKNFRDVTIVVDPADYARVIAALDASGGPSPAMRFDLARKAFAHTGAYDATISATLAEIDSDSFARTRPAVGLPAVLTCAWPKVRDLRYGENPHQVAAWYATSDQSGLGAANVLQGKELSYTNLLDLDAAARLVAEFDEPAACVIKHTNPCGVATGTTITMAYVSARDADARSAFGGIVGLNRPIDAETARAITSTFIECVIAPGVTDDARPVLAGKANMRVIVCDTTAASVSAPRMEWRSVVGGLLVQASDRVVEAQTPWGTDAALDAIGLRVVTRRHPTSEEWQALRFAWRVCAHVKSNTILFTATDRTLAIGAGQMSRVDSVALATMKALEPLRASVVASDAFFPFRDGLDLVAAAGATAVVQPGGSVRDAEVIDAADAHDMAMVFTGRRHFRH